MARPNKSQRYADNFNSDIVLDSDKLLYHEIAGCWREKFFKNDHAITLELACGRGEYTIGLASRFPEVNHVGVDIKGDRIWKASTKATELGLNNVCLVRSKIELIPQIFMPREVNEIWLTFPDPRPKDRDEKHRLNNIYFLNMYRSLLSKDGWFRLKTDNIFLFEYGLNELSKMPVRDMEITTDLYESDLLQEHYGLTTKYEKIWTEKGEKIKYMKCRFG